MAFSGVRESDLFQGQLPLSVAELYACYEHELDKSCPGMSQQGLLLSMGFDHLLSFCLFGKELESELKSKGVKLVSLKLLEEIASELLRLSHSSGMTSILLGGQLARTANVEVSAGCLNKEVSLLI